MKFKDLKVGQWFTFASRMPFSGSPQGPFKKNGAKTYLYHHPHGWFETKIGSIGLAVLSAERPEDAPHELVDIHVGWHEGIGGYLLSTSTYKTRDVEEADETVYEIEPNVVFVEETSETAKGQERDKAKAKNKALEAAKKFGLSLLTDGIEVEMVVIFLEGSEWFVITQAGNKAEAHAGAFNPRKKVNRKEPA